MSKPELFAENEEIFKLQQEIIELKRSLEEEKTKNHEAPFLRPDKTFGVAVSGDVHLNKMEVEIVNAPMFQRLRKVKQLGSTYLVYPSAVHTRFEHSLGTLKKAELIIERIRKNKHNEGDEKNITAQEEQIIRLIALLHDIGHTPFGHTIEDEFGILKSHDKHETRWEYFVGEFSEIGKIILKYHPKNTNNLFERFFNLIKCEKNFDDLENDAFMYDIVSNTVCADLLDYLERDCIYTNLRFKFHYRFLDYFFIKKIFSESDKRYERRIAIRIYKKGKKEIRHDVISELIQLLRYRYYLGERVYYHHTKIKTGTLLAGAVLRAKEAECFKELSIEKDFEKDFEEFGKKIKNNLDKAADKVLYNIHKMGDEELILYLKNLPKAGKDKDKLKIIANAERLANAFDNRILYDEIKFWTKENLGIGEKDIEAIDDYLKEANPDFRKEKRTKIAGHVSFKIFDRLIIEGSFKNRIQLEDKICSYLPGMDSGDVLIYCPTFKMAMKLAQMQVAYVSEVETGNAELTSKLKDFYHEDDKTTKEDCHSIIMKHQELWALRILVNPKFTDTKHREYKPEYAEYKQLIINFMEWQILGKSNEDTSQKGRLFLNPFLRTRLKNISTTPLISSIADNVIYSVTEDLVVHNNSLKNLSEIDAQLKEGLEKVK